MLTERPELYNLQTSEQLRAVADELRQRILEELVERAMTVTQLGDLLGMAPAKVHYHVRELERVGLLTLVETREKGGILEKYYLTVARRLDVPPELFQHSRQDSHADAVREMLRSVSDGFTGALMRGISRGRDIPLPHMSLIRSHLYLTDDEYAQFTREIQSVLDRYERAEPPPNARQYTNVLLAYDTALSLEARGLSAESEAEDGQPEEPRDFVLSDITGQRVAVSRKNRVWAIGAFSFDRDALERAVQEGRLLDITVMGFVQFTADVSSDLVDRAVGRFKHRGIIRAGDDVLDVLAQKEAATRGA